MVALALLGLCGLLLLRCSHSTRLIPGPKKRQYSLSNAMNTLAGCRVMPNPSVNLTRYGRLCKPGPRHLYYRREPGLQALPSRAGYLER